MSNTQIELQNLKLSIELKLKEKQIEIMNENMKALTLENAKLRAARKASSPLEHEFTKMLDGLNSVIEYLKVEIEYSSVEDEYDRGFKDASKDILDKLTNLRKSR